MSFFQLGAEERLKDNQLLSLHRMLDWHKIEHVLRRVHKRDWTHGGGPTPYPPIQMFKALLLAHWHQLSDRELINSLKVRLDFMMFTGFDLGSELPDDSTICRFRNRLLALGLDAPLFDEINQQLAEKGLAVKEAATAVVDATIIESACRPRRCIEVFEDREEPQGSSTDHARIIESADPDARWLKKGNRFHFGYKGFVTVEGHHGFIRGVHVTPANASEVKELERAVHEAGKMSSMFADKGYASQANREFLEGQGITDGIMYKASRGRSLDATEKLLNRMISRIRYKVEQCFGTLKRRFGFSRSRYKTTEKVTSEFYWKAMCFNLLKAERLLRVNCA